MTEERAQRITAAIVAVSESIHVAPNDPYQAATGGAAPSIWTRYPDRTLGK